jgi:hypothetical protein
MAIQVFDHGKEICLLHREELDPQDDAIMQLLSVNIDGEDIDVLYFFDMDYGIVVDKHTADVINGKIDKILEEKEPYKPVSTFDWGQEHNDSTDSIINDQGKYDLHLTLMQIKNQGRNK